MPDRFSEDYGVNARRESVMFVKDFTPDTILEDNRQGGAAVNMPEGNATGPRATFQTAGGRGSTDYISAEKLGSTGSKRK